MKSLGIQNHHNGAIAVAMVELTANRKGYIVSKPTIETRYDLLIDINNYIYRCQVKYASKVQNNCLQLSMWRGGSNLKSSKSSPYSRDEIDILCLYVPSINAILLLYPEDFDGKTSISINLKNPEAHNYYKKYLW